MAYGYEQGRERIIKILNSELKVEEKETKSVGDLTYDNSYISWITGIFIDIRDSSSLFGHQGKVNVSKIIKTFTSEVIEILRSSNLDCLELGIRGDCVYAVYSTSAKTKIQEVLTMAFYINTLMKMLNKLYQEKGYKPIKIGIGISTDQELIMKAGRKNIPNKNENLDANATVWVGKAVSLASKFSSYGNKNGIKTIVISGCTYSNILSTDKEFFAECTHDGHYIYHANVIINSFYNWIDGGMK